MTPVRHGLWRGVLLCLATTPALFGAQGCGTAQEASETTSFDVHFATVARISLAQDTTAPLGDVGVVAQASNGDLVIADALVPHLMRFDSQGNLVARFGTYGDGPFEFRSIQGVLEDPDGNVVVVDPQRSRITILDAALRPDTAFLLFPRPRGPIFRMGDGYLLSTVSAPRVATYTRMTRRWSAVWTVPSPMPADAGLNPFWGSYSLSHVAASDELAVTAYSFLYPVHVYDRRGVLIDSIGSPSPAFRPATVVQPGAFAGPGGEERRDQWLRSFDVIADVAIVADSFLVVTHGGRRVPPDGGRTWTEYERLDVYHLPSRSKISEDVPFPEGGRVVGSGPGGLLLLVSQPPDPWTILRVLPRAALSGER